METIKQAVNCIEGCTYVQELDPRHHQIIVDGVTRVLRTKKLCEVDLMVAHIRHHYPQGAPVETYTVTKDQLRAIWHHGWRQGGTLDEALAEVLN